MQHSAQMSPGPFSGRRWRRLKENLTAYAFILPAFLIIGTFGLFPIGFAVYVSMHRWRIKPGDYLGLGNYVRALDSFAYVVAFWLALILIVLAIRSVWRAAQKAREHGDRAWAWILPALVMTAGIGQFLRFFVLLLPEVLGLGDKLKGQERTQELFLQFLGEAWRTPAVQAAFRSSIAILVVAMITAYLIQRFVARSPRGSSYFSTFVTAFLLLGIAVLLSWLTYTEIQAAYTNALENGEGLELWAQIVTISAGFVLLGVSWWLWRSAAGRDSMISTALRLAAAAVLAVGAWVLIGELPRVITAGDKDWWQGLKVTAYYSIGTVPFQLGISLILANLLFQDIRGKGLFRLIYFLPYITPAVAAAAVFRVFFSGRPTAPINSLVGLLGGQPLLWLDEPKGIFQMLAGGGADFPAWAAGPSLALVVIIIFNIWSYIGYDTVIFLAGLGGIPGELYEAASIDGAGRLCPVPPHHPPAPVTHNLFPHTTGGNWHLQGIQPRLGVAQRSGSGHHRHSQHRHL